MRSSGIGYATVVQLARHGAKIYVAARTEKRALVAIEKLYRDNPSVKKGSVVWLPLELGDLDQVRTAAKAFLKKEERLDILGEHPHMSDK